MTWASTASDRTKWRRLCHSLLDQFESQRIANLEHRREKTQQVHKSRLSGPSAASTVGARVHPRSGCLLIGGAAIPHPPLSVNHVLPQVQTSLLQLRPQLYSPAVTVAGHVHPGSECSLISELRFIENDDSVHGVCVCVCPSVYLFWCFGE